jgi:DNA polymerase I-like protein with 3'-5' exonuclease and polymerase domains
MKPIRCCVKYINEQIHLARERGYVETVLGRKRYLNNINSQNAVVRSAEERNAINAPIQGSAADIIKLAMIQIQQAFGRREITNPKCYSRYMMSWFLTSTNPS